MSIIEEDGEQRVRMAALAIVGSHSVNGVARIHTEILKDDVFRDFYELTPEKFNNKTNGITQRRWLLKSNPDLARLITEAVGGGWVTDLDQLEQLVPLARRPRLRRRVAQGQAPEQAPPRRDHPAAVRAPGHRARRRSRLALRRPGQAHPRVQAPAPERAARHHALQPHPGRRPPVDVVPRTVIFGGKAAPGYVMAKLIIRLINAVGDVVNNDPAVRGRLNVVFLADYRVSLAEQIFPGSELSEQISTAGTEASGTGNMKFALNGALTIGTMDGANIEIREEVGDDNIFIFGLTAPEVAALRPHLRPRRVLSGRSRAGARPRHDPGRRLQPRRSRPLPAHRGLPAALGRSLPAPRRLRLLRRLPGRASPGRIATRRPGRGCRS